MVFYGRGLGWLIGRQVVGSMSMEAARRGFWFLAGCLGYLAV